MTDQAIKDSIERWLVEVVIEKSFCPFAGRPFKSGRVCMPVVFGNREETLMAFTSMLKELFGNDDVETCLLICPSERSDFLEFNETLSLAEALATEMYPGVFSIAGFHPKFQFAGEHSEAVVNYIHRSPEPIIHIIRESSISWALEHHKGIDEITGINEQHAELLGKAFFQSYL